MFFYLFLTPTLGRSFQKFIEVMSFEILFGFEGLFFLWRKQESDNVRILCENINCLTSTVGFK